MLLVQEYLRHHTFGQLESEHGVSISVDRRYGHKFSLNYSQYNSAESDELASQCRGLILTNGSSLWEKARKINKRWSYSEICPGSTQIIAAPMFRFFNLGQPFAATVDWRDPELKVYDKCDGTLAIVSFDQIIHQWHVATRSTPEADVPFNGLFTFRTLFEKALLITTGLTFKDFCAKLDPGFTYCFEITSPYNQIVVKHQEPGLHFLAARNKITLQEWDPALITGVSEIVPVAPTMPQTTAEEIQQYTNQQCPSKHEGVVVCDSQFRRIKIKNPAYVNFNGARDSLSKSPRACLELIMSKKEDDVLPFMPDEVVAVVLDVKEKFSSFVSEFNKTFGIISAEAARVSWEESHKPDWNAKKIFAMTVKKHNVWETPCYQIYAGRAESLLDFFEINKVAGTWQNSFLDTVLAKIGYKNAFLGEQTSYDAERQQGSAAQGA